MIIANNLNYDKLNGLIPAVIQDALSKQVLMVGFMNPEAVQKTVDTKLVTFFSRSRKELWTKGETSGNYLNVVDMKADCDSDTLLIKAIPSGNTCHTGIFSCFGEKEKGIEFFDYLFELIQARKAELPEGSYTTSLFQSGIERIAQKVGEEAVETVIASLSKNQDAIKNESADLLFHLFVLLSASGITLTEVAALLEERHKK